MSWSNGYIKYYNGVLEWASDYGNYDSFSDESDNKLNGMYQTEQLLPDFELEYWYTENSPDEPVWTLISGSWEDVYKIMPEVQEEFLFNSSKYGPYYGAGMVRPPK